MMEFGNPQDMAWQGETALFYVRYNGRKILCRISAEAIDDHFGNPIDDGARLDAAKENFDQVTDLAGEKIARGLSEPDGTILIRTRDF